MSLNPGDIAAAALRVKRRAELQRKKLEGEAASFQPSTADTLTVGAGVEGVDGHDPVLDYQFADGLPADTPPIEPNHDSPVPDAQPLADAAEAKKPEGPDGTERQAVEDDPKKPYGDVPYADPGYQDDKQKRYPVDTEEHVRAAWSYINRGSNSSAYSAEDLTKVKGRIVTAWKKLIDKDGPPSEQAAAGSDGAQALWSEDDHPRDADGKFGSGGGPLHHPSEVAGSSDAHAMATDYHHAMQESLDESGQHGAAILHSKAFDAHEAAIDASREHGQASPEFKAASDAARKASSVANRGANTEDALRGLKSVDVRVGKPFVGTAKDVYNVRPHDAAIAEKAARSVEHAHAAQYHETAAKELDALGHKAAAEAHRTASEAHKIAAGPHPRLSVGLRSGGAREASKAAHDVTRRSLMPHKAAADDTWAEVDALAREVLQPRDEIGRFAAGSDGEMPATGYSARHVSQTANTPNEHKLAYNYHVMKANEEHAAGNHEAARSHYTAAKAHGAASKLPNPSSSSTARQYSHVASSTSTITKAPAPAPRPGPGRYGASAAPGQQLWSEEDHPRDADGKLGGTGTTAGEMSHQGDKSAPYHEAAKKSGGVAPGATGTMINEVGEEVYVNQAPRGTEPNPSRSSKPVRSTFTDYHEARSHAMDMADKHKQDIAIRGNKEFGKKVFYTSLASKNDSDYARAEIVKPNEPRGTAPPSDILKHTERSLKGKFPGRNAGAAGRADLIGVAMAAGVLTDLQIVGPAQDSELPAELRGKGLIRGKPVKLWPVGTSEARDGRVFVVNHQAIASLLEDGNEGVAPVPFTYAHEDPDVDPEMAGKNSGYMTHFTADAKFVYADQIYWTQAAAKDIQSGERGFVSPDAYCQPLDPDTLRPLPAGAKTNTYMPLYWRAASLVPVPALSNLPPVSLTAQAAAARPNTRKESQMDRETLAALGLPEDATPEQARAAVLTLKNEKLAFSPDFPKKQHEDGGHKDGAVDDCPACADSQKAAAEPKGEKEPDGDEAEAAAAKAVKGQMPAIALEAAKHATKLVRADLAAQDAAAKIDAELLAFEKDGKLVAAEREYFRAGYEKDAAKTREMLTSRKGGAIVPDAQIESGGIDPSLSVDSLAPAEANEILSRAAGWHLHTGKPFELALSDVRLGASSEGTFHRQVLKCNPDWGKDKKTGARGDKWPTAMRRSYLTSVELDTDMLEKIGQQLHAGKIPTNLIPADLQREALQRMKLAGEVSSFQPPTKFQIAGFGFGFFQGEFGGSEIGPEVTGGANEEASYPVYGAEKLQVHVNASGVPEPVGRNASDIEESVWGADFKKVTLHGYGNRVWADRRDQSAGDAVLPMGVMATVTEQALTIEKNKKELAQAAHFRASTSYETGFTKDLNTGSRQWQNASGSTPIQDWQGARITVWRAVGAFPDISLVPPDVVETLRFHPDFLKAAQAAGMTHIDQPEAMVPIEMLVAILGPMIVPTCRISTTITGGADADTPWGQDVILAVTSKGKVVAPRAFATVVSAGYPIVRGMVDDRRGLNGSDGIAVSDMYSVETVGIAAAAKTKSAFLFQNATQKLVVI